LGLTAFFAFGAGALMFNGRGRTNQLPPHASVTFGDASTDDPASSTAQASSERSVAELWADAQKRHDDAIAAHWQEPTDDRWAPEMTQTLRRELTELTRKGEFSVVRVDCRSESCVAIIEWPNYQRAMKNWNLVLQVPRSAPCGVEAALQDPIDPKARYQTSVFFKCSVEDRSRQL